MTIIKCNECLNNNGKSVLTMGKIEVHIAVKQTCSQHPSILRMRHFENRRLREGLVDILFFSGDFSMVFQILFSFSSLLSIGL